MRPTSNGPHTIAVMPHKASHNRHTLVGNLRTVQSQTSIGLNTTDNGPIFSDLIAACKYAAICPVKNIVTPMMISASAHTHRHGPPSVVTNRPSMLITHTAMTPAPRMYAHCGIRCHAGRVSGASADFAASSATAATHVPIAG